MPTVGVSLREPRGAISARKGGRFLGWMPICFSRSEKPTMEWTRRVLFGAGRKKNLGRFAVSEVVERLAVAARRAAVTFARAEFGEEYD
jgi:hypothetical protein